MSLEVTKGMLEVRAELFKLENQNYRTLDFYRQTTKRLLAVFSDCQVIGDDGGVDTVPIWYANPERAIAKIYEGRTLNLPAMTLNIESLDNDEDRRRPNFGVQVWKEFDEVKNKAIRVAALAPRAVKVTYKLNLWTRYVEDMNQLVELVHYKFHPHIIVPTNFNDNTHAFLKSTTDNSVVDVPDREDRLIKKAITFEVETYIPSRKYEITSTGSLRELRFDVSIED
jgi:hypothetical protein